MTSKEIKICLIIFIILLVILLIPISILSYYYFYTDTVDCFCKLGVNRKIIRGKEASENFIPYQVSITFEEEHICSGVLINSHFILTAAHCIDNLSIWKLKIRVGISKLNSTDIDDKTYRVIRSFIHPSYNESIEPNENDIGLLRTFFPIKFEHTKTDSACLNLNEKKTYSTLIVTGFGCYKNKISKKTNRCKQSNSLRYAEYRETLDCEKNCEDSKKDCKEYCNRIIIANPILEQSLCNGDSGGPICQTKNGNTTVEGIASYVFSGFKNMPNGLQKIPCAGKAIFTRLSSNKLFIEEIIGNNYCGNLN